MIDQKHHASQRLILASRSPYRRELLQRLGLPFECQAAEVDESRHPDEGAEAMVQRLAEAKAAAIAQQEPGCFVIGSDQVAINGSTILGKPGKVEHAHRQLADASGKTVTFLTGLCLIAPDGSRQCDLIPYRVRFRTLAGHEIREYIRRENPLDCAGSFKSEGLGVTLFDAMEGSDPTALIGLPLIRLCAMLREAGLDPLGAPHPTHSGHGDNLDP